MNEVDITIDGWDPKPVKMWIVTIGGQPELDSIHFMLYCDDKVVKVKRRMFNGVEVVTWNPKSDEKAVLFNFCRDELAHFARKELDRFIARFQPASQVNLYIVRDHFNMTFGVAITSDPDRLTEHESYDIEAIQTISQTMMENMK